MSSPARAHEGPSALTQALRDVMSVGSLMNPSDAASTMTTGKHRSIEAASSIDLYEDKAKAAALEKNSDVDRGGISNELKGSDEHTEDPNAEGNTDSEAVHDGQPVSENGLPVSTCEWRAFNCMNDEYTTCNTGQYQMSLSRKVISDYFGRNKACTRDITDWPLFCRKHYQRATYDKAKWQKRKIALILRQLDVIGEQFPGTTYDVALKHSEESRLNDYARKVAGGLPEPEAANAVAPKSGKLFEAPIYILRELDRELGKGKTKEHVVCIAHIIVEMLDDGDIDQVPAIEFLPQLPHSVTAPSTPKKTPKKGGAKTPRDPKMPKTPKTPKTSPKSLQTPNAPKALKTPVKTPGQSPVTTPTKSSGPRRISKSGGIKKLGQNA